MRTLLFIICLSLPVTALALNTINYESVQYEKKLDLQYQLAAEWQGRGHIGKTMLHLKRAYSIAPLDGDVQSAINHLRRDLEISPGFYYQEPLSTLMRKLLLFIPLDLLSIISLVLLAAGSLVWSAGLAGKIVQRGSALYKAGLITFLVSIGLLGLTLGRQLVFFNHRQAVVMQETGMHVRPEQDISSAENLPAGMECRILDEEKGYYLVQSLDGKQGWVDTKKVSRIWPTL